MEVPSSEHIIKYATGDRELVAYSEALVEHLRALKPVIHALRS